LEAELRLREPIASIHSGWSPELEGVVRTKAVEAGFSLFGIASADSSSASGDAAREDDRFALWIEQGRAGEMEYLKRRDANGTLLRSELRVAIPWARSIIVCAFNYGSPEPASIEQAPAGAGWIGRYAWSGSRREATVSESEELQAARQSEGFLATDYHDELLGRLKLVEATLLGAAPCQTRCYVDTGPIVEREFAARAGIGWIGKNTCVLNQELGSWLLLGVIVTSLPMLRTDPLEIVPDRCGSCTRCIDACPTDALVAPRQMDASRCIA